MKRIAILLDGGFVRPKLEIKHARVPTVADFEVFIDELLQNQKIKALNAELLRTYYYDAMPHGGTETNPIDQSKVNYSRMIRNIDSTNLIRGLELAERVAVRKGECRPRGWEIDPKAFSNVTAAPPGGGPTLTLSPRDIKPKVEQKGVDIRIGLDIAWMSTKRIVDVMILVTGDSDFIPAMKFARKEGVLIALHTFGHSVYQELKVHADILLA